MIEMNFITLRIKLKIYPSVDENIIPFVFELSAYPNPFNPTKKNRFTVPSTNVIARKVAREQSNIEIASSASPIRHEANKVILKIYDILGNEITTLVNEQKHHRTYEVIFDPSNLAIRVYL